MWRVIMRSQSFVKMSLVTYSLYLGSKQFHRLPFGHYYPTNSNRYPRHLLGIIIIYHSRL